jgi:hypothetical protein
LAEVRYVTAAKMVREARSIFFIFESLMMVAK